jgi:methylenetetrahydrofolate dehydrogenase (NADP+)/methenyltetrahydrofolate cyclohydrolase
MDTTTMTLLDGKALSTRIKERLTKEVETFKSTYGTVPGLAVILVGNDPASHAYVKMKETACEQVGVYSVVHKFPDDTPHERIRQTVEMINNNPNLHGLLIQLPLPEQMDTLDLLDRIAPERDVDGFHPFNFGKLFAGLETFAPCTPLGVMRLLEAYDIDPKGKDVVVIGASNIVGKPMAALLLNAGASVDICHIFTRDLAEHTRRADIVVVGVGKPGLITADMIKEGAVVIDIGINRLESGKLVGDVDYEAVVAKCSAITPVPGGVGPMTIAMLLENTLKAAQKSAQSKNP